MPPNGRWLCSVMGGAKVLLFSLFPWDCWCCIFHYLFSISTHGRLTWFFSALCFYWYFLRNSEVLVLSSFPSYAVLKWGQHKAWSDPSVFKCAKGDSDFPLSSHLLATWLFSPWVIIQISLPPHLQLRPFCGPWRKEMCQIWLHFAEFGVSQSSQVNTGLC